MIGGIGKLRKDGLIVIGNNSRKSNHSKKCSKHLNFISMFTFVQLTQLMHKFCTCCMKFSLFWCKCAIWEGCLGGWAAIKIVWISKKMFEFDPMGGGQHFSKMSEIKNVSSVLWGGGGKDILSNFLSFFLVMPTLSLHI